MRDLGERDEDLLEKRGADDWSAAEDATLVAIRRQGAPGRGRASELSGGRFPWPRRSSFSRSWRPRDRTRPRRRASEETAGLSTQDRADDALLRDVDSLASGDDTAGAGALAPEPGIPEPAAPEEGRS